MQSKPAQADKSISIMQPYFIPYAGYFRLLLASGLFVIYDDVQFKKGGWIHRNRLPNANHEPTFLTLPIKRMPLDTNIMNMQFQEGAQQIWEKSLRQFPVLNQHNQNPLIDWLTTLSGTPIDYIIQGLKTCCQILKIPFNVVRSSNLDIPKNLTGQDRVLHVVESQGGNRYINAPQGRALYQHDAFNQRGIELNFLPDYNGNMVSILHRLLTEDPSTIRQEIETNL